jgi:tetratricopeptide (TPR) repeat protein
MTNLQPKNLKQEAIKTALTGDWENAIHLNKMLLSEDPNDIDALNRLALAYTITGKIKNAKTTYKKVFLLDPLNTIATKNLKRIKDKGLTAPVSGYQINNNFLEETGKTKIVELVNIAQPKIIENLRTGETVSLSIKRSRIFVLEEDQYIGVLPDDIGKRLIKFIKSGNKYEAYIKCASVHKVLVFIKESKRVSKLKFHPSFISTSETAFVFDKNNKIKNQIKNSEKDEDEESEDSD